MRWAFAILLVIPVVVLQLPLTSGTTSAWPWRLDTAAAIVLGGVLVVLWQRPVRRRFRWALTVFVGSLATTAVQIATADRSWWFGWGVSWVLVMLAATCVSWVDDWARDRRFAVLAAISGLLALFSPLLSGGEYVWYQLPTYSFLSIVAIAAGLFLRAHRRRLVEQRAEVQERERQAMASELHDVIAHEITGVVVLTQAVGLRLPDQRSRDDLARIEQSATRALSHIRALVAASRSGGEQQLVMQPRNGNLSDIAELVDEFSATTSARVVVDVIDAEVSGPVAVTAHRVVAEALTNVRRHAASAGLISVSVTQSGELLRVTVRDDGAGTGLGSGGGFGLNGLASRATLVGGTVSAGPASGGGWIVEALLPTGQSAGPRREAG